MHKKLLNEIQIDLVVKPAGPILVKSGRESSADPTILDMNFVRVNHPHLGRTVFLPGSSLKGTVRSYCEKIARTLDRTASADMALWCDPLSKDSCVGRWPKTEEDREPLTPESKYRMSCAICRVFGNTGMGSHIRFSDAYPPTAALASEMTGTTEQRDGVAIDRISGAVARGPFSLETVTTGEFHGTLRLTNFQLWQVGLLAIALRDMALGYVPMGFGKSRGLGRIDLDLVRLEVSCPGQFGQSARDFGSRLYGLTCFVGPDEAARYGLIREGPEGEGSLPLPSAHEVVPEWGRATLTIDDREEMQEILKRSVSFWAGLFEKAG